VPVVVDAVSEAAVAEPVSRLAVHAAVGLLLGVCALPAVLV
jgi:hypothetical protein